MSFFYQKKVRDLFWQAFVLVGVLALLAFFVVNASRNMRDAGIASGFDFLWRTAGIEVPFVLTDYTAQSDNLDAALGRHRQHHADHAGLGRRPRPRSASSSASRGSRATGSSRTIAGAYVEAVRNIPLLFFVLFWYFGVIAALPGPRQSIGIFGVAFLNNRGLTIPLPNYVSPFGKAALVILGALAIQIGFAWWARRRRDRTGKDAPVWTIGYAAARRAADRCADAARRCPTSWDVPALRGFNFRGGFVLVPEFVALFAALDDLHRRLHRRDRARRHPGGAEGPARGGGSALGLRRAQILRLVVIPQALRVMIPPMTSQYLNVLKNSSFGAAIAYPELVSVFMGSALNNTGQAIEIIAITLSVYLAIGLCRVGLHELVQRQNGAGDAMMFIPRWKPSATICSPRRSTRSSRSSSRSCSGAPSCR